MLTWYLCDLQGIWTSIAKKPYIFVIFQGGGGGQNPLSPLLDQCMLPVRQGFFYYLFLFVIAPIDFGGFYLGPGFLMQYFGF